MRTQVRSLALLSGLRIWHCVDRKLGLDLALLWLWRSPAATAPVGPLAWEPPYAARAALKKKKKKKQILVGTGG